MEAIKKLIWLCIVILMISHTCADIDWLQKCGICRCKWNSGKKTADCRNTSMTVVPTEMSSELQVIDLSFNQIPELRRDEFKDANIRNLHKIYMKNCTLEEINRDALSGLEVLIELDISNNIIKVLHPGTFKGSNRLRTLIMNNNELEVLEDYLFETLPFLYKVELRENRLHRIGLQTFVECQSLLQIFLDSNRLSVLKPETFEKMNKLISLSLSENPWNCTCELQQFQKFVIKENLYTKPTSCSQPPHLRGKLWSDISAEDFACRPRIIQPKAGSATIDATNDNVTLTCRIKGSPKPDILWLYNKRPLNYNDHRINIKDSQEINRRDSLEIYTSELTIFGVRPSDKGSYICSAKNNGGKDEAEINLTIPPANVDGGTVVSSSSNLLLLIGLIVTILLTLLIILALVLFCYCRRVKKYTKNGSISENGLVSNKMNKTQNDSMLEGSVIMEMQKSLLTEVNPVESYQKRNVSTIVFTTPQKPPRRNELDSTGDIIEDGHDMKKTLLDETNFANHDDETRSISLSDTTPRSRATFIDDGYGTNLPPDLLAFPSRFTQSPSLQSSMSNIQDGRIYIKSPVASPIYQHNPNIYTTNQNAGFRTLQHPKNIRNMSVINRSNSPFTPAPIMYTPVVMKQGYVTIPRKQKQPRTPSWSSTMTDFPPTSPTSTMSSELAEPVYDNLGLRTTASGNSVSNLNKVGKSTLLPSAQNNPYSMKHRILPATPASRESALIEESNQLHHRSSVSISTDDKEALYSNKIPTIVKGGVKVPPRPPPKPKKKKPINGGNGSTSQLFEDEGEDGTEV